MKNDDLGKMPSIRFKGFTNAWEQRNLSDVLTERNVQHSQNKVYPLVSFTVERGVTPKTDRYEREQLVRGDKSAKKYKATELDDIVYNPANLKFGAIARNKYGKAVFSPIYVTLEVNANLALPKYIERIVTKQDFIQYALKYQQGTVYERQSVSPENLLSLSIPLPLIQEQEVIGKFFDLFDNLITLHQRKLDKTKELKKTMLSKMFPKNDEDKPELRFSGFTDAWELRKLIDIVNRVNKSSNSNELPKVEFEDIVSGEGRLNKDVFLKLDDRKGISFEPENILYGKLRPYLKNWLFPNFSGVALGDFWVFKATNISVPSFDFYLIQSDNYQKVANDTSGTKMPRSDWKNVSSTVFAIPGKQEQQIGTLFQNLDNLITLHQRELEQLINIKKTLLKHMFV